MTFLLGIDVGTSATKAVLCDDQGRVKGSGSAEYPLLTPRPGWTEQEPAQWWRAAVAASRAAVSDAGARSGDVRAISFSGQMHGSVLLDPETLGAQGKIVRALRPAILWNDQRTAPQCERIESSFGGRRAMVELVGNAALTGFTLPKLLWVQEHEPEVWSSVAGAMLPKDFVRFCMTGQPATDVGDAAGTLLLDVDRRDWSDRAVEAAGIDKALLPPVLESCASAGRLSDHAATELGLDSGIEVIAGSGDNMAGAVGAGVVAPGVVLATLGTSGVVYAHASRPKRDLGDPPGRLHTMCTADGTAHTPGHWCLTGCTLSAAGSLQWARDKLFPGEPFDALVEEASGAPIGCDGLLFLPHITGERCPYPDPTARGAWVGLSVSHGRGHLVRAVLEGVTMTMARIMAIVREAGVAVDEIRLGGGGAQSPLWRQMLADAFNAPVHTLETEEGPAHGAALMAGVGLGVWPSVAQACEASIKTAGVTEPDPGAAAAYQELGDILASTYESLRGPFASLASR